MHGHCFLWELYCFVVLVPSFIPISLSIVEEQLAVGGANGQVVISLVEDSIYAVTFILQLYCLYQLKAFLPWCWPLLDGVSGDCLDQFLHYL